MKLLICEKNSEYCHYRSQITDIINNACKTAFEIENGHKIREMKQNDSHATFVKDSIDKHVAKVVEPPPLKPKPGQLHKAPPSDLNVAQKQDKKDACFDSNNIPAKPSAISFEFDVSPVNASETSFVQNQPCSFDANVQDEVDLVESNLKNPCVDVSSNDKTAIDTLNQTPPVSSVDLGVANKPVTNKCLEIVEEEGLEIVSKEDILETVSEDAEVEQILDETRGQESPFSPISRSPSPVQFEITPKGVRVISDRESFL